MNDTIAAIATAPGEAGIGIVRLSGPDAIRLATAVFLPAGRKPDTWRPDSHRAVYGRVRRRDPAGREEVLDDCVLTCFLAPHSFTGEDLAELACHGSNLVLGLLLGECFRLGARPAEPGEFTQRAFLNGRMDLSAAEAVIDIIQARSEAALRVATGQSAGRLATAIGELRAGIVSLMAEMEVALDFPDDYDPPPVERSLRRLSEWIARIEELLATAGAGRLYREGAAVALAGRPNVGKSSLLNALLGEERAIVTEIPGTTRDTIEETLVLGGAPVRLIDTAGLRGTEDRVESLGVERARRSIESADLVLGVLDAAEGFTEADAEALRLAPAVRLLLVGNKIDLGDALPAALPEPFARMPLHRLSARTGEGLAALRAAMAAALGAGVAPESVWVSRARHEQELREALARLRAASASIQQAADLPATLVDLRLAAEALGQITGETVSEETIREIFARFCVGK